MITKGSVDSSAAIRAVSTTTNQGVALTSESEGLTLWYMREGEAPVSLDVSDLASADAAHVDGGIYHLGNGWHRVCLPDDAVATGDPDWVLVGGGATGCIIISSKEDFTTTTSAVTTTTTTPSGTSEGIANIEDLMAAPLFTRTDEGAVRERTVDELIKADMWARGDDLTAVPWGMRIAKTKPTGTVVDDL